MTRHGASEVLLSAVMQAISTSGEDAPSVEDKLSLVARLRQDHPEVNAELDELLVRRVEGLHTGLAAAREVQGELRARLDTLASPPWYAAVFVSHVETGQGSFALVRCQGSWRMVRVSEEVEPGSLAAGDEVYLSGELNALMARAPERQLCGGETAVFERRTSDGRLVVRSRDEEVVALAADALGGTDLKPGDRLRWDRDLWMAFEKVGQSEASRLFLEDAPAQTFASVGGLDAQIAAIQRLILLHLRYAETARTYDVRRRGSVLLVGPPGTGKTMLARALANWLASVSPSGRSFFMSIKPSALHSMWYGQSEANYREAFRVARESCRENPGVPVVMFFDEVDAIGAARGESLARVHDRVLPAFMAELDGLEERKEILVVGATNRADALDPALLRPGRLGDLVLEVPRPDRNAARMIFGKYLHDGIPVADGTVNGATAREAAIEAILSRLYAANGEGELASIMLRDGSRRAVRARDLVSGASIANVVTAACERACLREVETGQRGVRLDDLLSAIDDELTKTVRVLTPANCRMHITNLPHDLDVVAVEVARAEVPQRHRYLRIA